MDLLHYVQTDTSFQRCVHVKEEEKIINNFLYTRNFARVFRDSEEKEEKKTQRGEDGADGEKENLMFKNKRKPVLHEIDKFLVVFYVFFFRWFEILPRNVGASQRLVFFGKFFSLAACFFLPRCWGLFGILLNFFFSVKTESRGILVPFIRNLFSSVARFHCSFVNLFLPTFYSLECYCQFP